MNAVIKKLEVTRHQDPLEQLRQQAQQGDEVAMFELGERYHKGDGVQRNDDVASDWWHQSAMKGYIPACHALGMFYILAQQDAENGLKWLEKAAEAAYLPAYRDLAGVYIEGRGVETDVEKGRDYLLKGAEQDDPTCLLRLAGLYHDGDYMELDEEKARYWLEKYFAHDIPEVHYRKGRCFFDADLYEQDYAKALEEFTLAVKGGYHDATPYYIYLRWNGHEVEKCQDEVLAIYQELAAQQDGHAAYTLYTLYKEEDSPYFDMDKSLSYLRQSAKFGYVDALREMGLQYLNDGLFETDYKKANYYLERAAEKGDTDAIINLAMSYRFGRGVEEDLPTAVRLYALATEYGDPYGICQIMRMIYSDMYHVTDEEEQTALHNLLEQTAQKSGEASFLLAYGILFVDTSKPYSQDEVSTGAIWMEKSAEQEYPDALFDLAIMYIEGRGVSIDLEKARQLLEICISKDIRTEDCRKILDEDLSDDHVGAEYKKFMYWYEIVTKTNKDKTYLDDEDNIKFQDVATDAALCGEPNAQLYCGLQYLQDDPDKAQEFLTMAIKQNDPGLAFTMGKMYFFGNNVEEDIQRAATYFKLGMEQDDLNCMLFMGHIYAIQDDSELHEAAKDLYRYVSVKSEEGSQENRTAVYYCGSLIYQEIEEGKSLDDYDSSDLGYLYFYTYVVGKFKMAADALVKMAELEDKPEGLLTTSHIYIFAGESQTAYEILDYCMEHLDDKETVLLHRGIANMLNGRDEEALKDLWREAIYASDEESFPFRGWCAELLYRTGHYEELLTFAQRLEKQGALKADVQLYLGRAYRALGREDEAVACLTAVSEIEVDDQSELAPAYALLLLQKYDECRALIDSGLDSLDRRLDYPMCFVYNNAAYYHLLMGDEEKAVEYFKKSVEEGYRTFDYLKRSKPELYACPAVKKLIDNQE